MWKEREKREAKQRQHKTQKYYQLNILQLWWNFNEIAYIYNIQKQQQQARC